ncbi:hypothetical protein CEXT_678271 [Caerostris extrusa]|uniref:Uncharacterized protein n=1 Tax=Caerostris extrusa TaxID=172846 RepID=A0AAV4VR96_CAEEX|nr:hypothetical protein CEXT_678271 [Caerostris extrusa]
MSAPNPELCALICSLKLCDGLVGCALMFRFRRFSKGFCRNCCNQRVTNRYIYIDTSNSVCDHRSFKTGMSDYIIKLVCFLTDKANLELQFGRRTLGCCKNRWRFPQHGMRSQVKEVIGKGLSSFLTRFTATEVILLQC